MKKTRTNESFSNQRKELGEVPFKKSAVTDPHIQQIIDHTSQTTGVPTGQIYAKIKGKITEIEDLKKHSKFLYETIAANVIEQAAFDLIETSPKLGNVQFDPVTFSNLVKLVQQDHSQFFPLRAPNDNEYIFEINPILVPSNKPELKQFNQVNTAAASENGDFIFNVPFMEKLIDFASVEKLKPQGKKYVSNGGTIPDEYGYIEFLIMHELLHYSYGDFAQGKLYKQFSHQEHNWASDFRSNYMLVKSGYSQLPIGLFSDHINYDRQGSYYDIIKLVHDEMAKLPQDKQQKAKDLLDDLLDDHGDPKDGDPNDGQDDGKPAAGEIGKDGRPVDPDAVHKDIESKLGGKSDSDETKGPSGKDGNKQGGPGGGPVDLNQVDTSQIKPKLSWRSILAKCVSSAKIVIETSYVKPSRRSVTGVAMAASLGAGPVKPGEKSNEEKSTKLVFVFDTSGSMGNTIATVLAEVQNLLKGHAKNLDVLFGVTYFASSAKYYEVNIAKNYYAEISDFTQLGKSEAVNRKPGFMHAFSIGGSGGTDFSSSLAGHLATAASSGFNIMTFSDSDITAGSNFANFQKLYSQARQHVFFIADSAATFTTMCNALGVVPNTFSHF